MINNNTKITYFLIGAICGVIGSYAVYALTYRQISNPSPEPTVTSTSATAGEGEHCGGNMSTALSCSAGLHCAPTPGSHLPFGDVGGICVKN